MAQNITLQGASYSDVPSILLPKTGGGQAQFDDTTIASNAATANDIASGKLAYVNGSLVTGTSTGGGGGASNVVTGTFTTVSTRGSSGTVSIQYTGSGYPIALLVYINNGVYNNTSSGNTDYYNSVNRYDVGSFCMTKSEMNTAPTFATSGSNNYGVATIIYKKSTTNPASFTDSSSVTTIAYNSDNAGNSTACIRFKDNGTTLSYKTGNLSSTNIGLVPSTEYAYIVIYSS